MFMTKQYPTVYEKFGDVNPIEHGGGLYTEISDGVFDIIHIEPDQNRCDLGWFNVVQVDTNDSWIQEKKEGLFSTYDMNESQNNSIDFALACIGYFGIENFGGDQSYEMLIDKRDIEESLNEVITENFIQDDNTIRCKVINYFDVWGNQKDGYQVNNMCNEGEITVPKDASNRDVVDALKKMGFFKKHVRMNMCQFESAYIDVWVINDSKGKPVCCVEPL
jgi:hypothetical protein